MKRRLLPYNSKIFFLIIFVFLAGSVFAQKKKKNLRVSNYKGNIKSFSNKRYFSVGGGINSLHYFGDLAPKSQWASTAFSFTRMGISAFIDYKFAPRISFRGSLEYGGLSGDDFKAAVDKEDNAKYRYVRNLQFRNRIFEFSFITKIDLFTNRGTYLSRPIVNPYIYIGVGGLYHNPQALAPAQDQLGNPITESGKWVDLQPLGTEGQQSPFYDKEPYSKLQLVIPAGLGVTVRLINNFDITYEFGYRVLFTDYIDDVSTKYVDLGALDDPLAKALSDRSQELTSATAGEPRDFEGIILPTTSTYTYTSEYDGNTYTVFSGYGHESENDIRGGASDNDIYFVNSIKITYIFGGTFRNAKFR